MTNVFKSFCHYQKAGYRHWGPLKLTMSSDQSSFLGGMGYQMRRINGKYPTSRTPAMQHGGTVSNVPFVNVASFSSNSSSSADTTVPINATAATGTTGPINATDAADTGKCIMSVHNKKQVCKFSLYKHHSRLVSTLNFMYLTEISFVGRKTTPYLWL